MVLKGILLVEKGFKKRRMLDTFIKSLGKSFTVEVDFMKVEAFLNKKFKETNCNRNQKVVM